MDGVGAIGWLGFGFLVRFGGLGRSGGGDGDG